MFASEAWAVTTGPLDPLGPPLLSGTWPLPCDSCPLREPTAVHTAGIPGPWGWAPFVPSSLKPTARAGQTRLSAAGGPASVSFLGVSFLGCPSEVPGSQEPWVLDSRVPWPPPPPSWVLCAHFSAACLFPSELPAFLRSLRGLPRDCLGKAAVVIRRVGLPGLGSPRLWRRNRPATGAGGESHVS